MPSLIWFSFQLDIFGIKVWTMLEIPSSNLTRHFGLSLWVFADSPGIECFYRFLSESFGLISLCGKSFWNKRRPPFLLDSIFFRLNRHKSYPAASKKSWFFFEFLGNTPGEFFAYPIPPGRKKGREICLASGERSEAPQPLVGIFHLRCGRINKITALKKNSNRTGNFCGFFSVPLLKGWWGFSQVTRTPKDWVFGDLQPDIGGEVGLRMESPGM